AKRPPKQPFACLWPTAMPWPLRSTLLRVGGVGRRVIVEVFLDAGRLAGAITQVVKLGATYRTTALDHDRVDGLAVALEHALDAFAMRNLAHGERGVEAGVLLGDDHAFIGLHALAVAFLDLDVDHDGVARAEI